MDKQQDCTENELGKMESELGSFFFKEFLRGLVYTGKMDIEKMEDSDYIDMIIKEQLIEGVQGLFNVSVSYEDNFEESIKSEIRQARYETAIVLCGTLVEHKLNAFYTEIMMTYHKFDENHIFQALNSTKIQDKMSWFFLLCTGRSFNSELRIKIEKLNTLRNKFVHYKPQFEDLDEMKKTDSLKKKVDDMSLELEKIPNELHDFLEGIERKIIPEKRISESLIDKFYQ